MIVSTRGRYALRVMIDLAEQDEHHFIPLKDIISRQGISQKYVEAIMTVLSKAGLVEAMRGKAGGYRLNRPPKDYAVGDILRATEETLAPVACLEDDAEPCKHASHCKTLPLWTELNNIVSSYLDSVSLADLIQKR
ncbi:MAG: RrF2 family transcriptional regulator [Fibrobacter sp.]|nr:RrF2 family transcriptional regulator [Fibrobacter sp.]